MKLTIDKIIVSEPDSFNGLTKTTFAYGMDSAYIFTKPENVPTVGQSLEGTVSPDKGGRMKFTKAKPDAGYTPAPRSQAPQERTFKADPEKLTQEKTLEIAKNQSIQRQVAVKGVVDLIVAGKRDYDDLHTTFVSLMELLTTHEWQKFVTPTEDLDLPPTDLYDDLTDEVEDGEL